MELSNIHGFWNIFFSANTRGLQEPDLFFPKRTVQYIIYLKLSLKLFFEEYSQQKTWFCPQVAEILLSRFV